MAASPTLTISGDFTNNGTFNPGNGTVVFNDAAVTSTLSGTGTITFYNLTSTAAGKTFRLQASKVFNVSNTLTLAGSSASRIILQSTLAGTQWAFNPTGGVQTVSYLNVSDGDSNTNKIITWNSLNTSNNVIFNPPAESAGWEFRTGASFSSAANQVFNVGDAATALSQITVTDAATTPTLTAANDIRIRIPDSLNMTWDPSDTTAVLGGTAAGKASTTVTFSDGNKTLVINVTANFAAADTLLVSGLNFTNFTGASSAGNLLMSIDGGSTYPVNLMDDKTKTITAVSGGAARLSSASSMTFSIGDNGNPQPAAAITVEDGGTNITAANNIRIVIPPAMNTEWDNSVALVTISGPSEAKIRSTSPNVTYSADRKTAIVDVIADFAAGNSITISGLKINPPAVLPATTTGNLGLSYDGDSTAEVTDDKTVTLVSSFTFDAVYSLVEFNGQLYAGAGTDTGTGGTAKIFRTSDGSTWTQVNTDGFGDANNIAVRMLAVWNGRLYAGTHNATTGAQLWVTSDGATWSSANSVNNNGFGNAQNVLIDAAAVFGQVRPEFSGGFFVTTQNAVTGAEVYVDPLASDIRKSCNKKVASVGDILTYEVTVTNSDGLGTLDAARVIDELPKGFGYVKGSAYLDGVKIGDPAGTTTRTFDIDFINVGQTRRLVYQLIVGAGVQAGVRYRNTATARGSILGAPITFPTVQCEVRVVNDPLFDEGTILGKVFRDANGNGVQDPGERGLPRANIFTEEGIRVTTDDKGKYHLQGVLPKRHLLKLDPRSLPKAAILTTPSEVLFETTPGLLSKVNFGVALPGDPAYPDLSRAPISKAREPLSSFVPKGWLKRAFYLSLAEGELQRNRVGGNRDIPDLSGNFDKRYNGEKRFAYYLDADLANNFKLYSSLDTGRRQARLFRNFDRRYYYPVYGDESSADYSMTETQGAFYARLQKGPSYALWGNYFTNLADSEILRYNRGLYGFKLHYVDPEKTVFGASKNQSTLFAARAKQIPSHDRFRMTGTSLYYLRNRHVIEGSERVSVIVEDLDNGLPTQTIQLTREDYEIHYAEGRIFLKWEVANRFGIQSFAPGNSIVHDDTRAGNPQYLVVDYEYEPESGFFDQQSYGGSVVKHFGDHLALGGVNVHEGKEGDDFDLRGVIGEYRWSEKTFLRGEYGLSEAEGIQSFVSTDGGLTFVRNSLGAKTRGDAVTLTAETVLAGRVNTKAYYKDISSGFSQTSVVENRGSEKWGASATMAAGASTTFTARHDVTIVKDGSSLTFVSVPGARRQAVTSLQAQKNLDPKTKLTGEYKANTTSDSLNPQVFENTHQAAVQFEREMSEKLKLLGRQQVTFQGEDNLQTGIGADIKLNETTKLQVLETVGEKGHSTQLSLGHEVKKGEVLYVNASAGSSGIGGFGLGPQGALDRGVAFGRQTQLDDKTSLTQETSVGQTLSQGLKQQAQNQAQSLVSKVTRVDRQVSDHWSARLSYELADLEKISGNLGKDAVSAALIYNNQKDLKNLLKIDYRKDNTETVKLNQTYFTDELDYRRNEDWTLKARTNFSVTNQAELVSPLTRFGEVEVGFAYRPVENNRFDWLGRYVLLWDKPLEATALENSAFKSLSHVWSTDLSYDLTQRLRVAEKFALRLRKETVDPEPERSSTTSLWVNRLSYDVYDGWGLAGEFRLLSQQETETYKSGCLLEVYKELWDFVRVSAGYNFTDFNDDLTDLDYDISGLFLRVSGTVSSRTPEEKAARESLHFEKRVRKSQGEVAKRWAIAEGAYSLFEQAEANYQAGRYREARELYLKTLVLLNQAQKEAESEVRLQVERKKSIVNEFKQVEQLGSRAK